MNRFLNNTIKVLTTLAIFVIGNTSVFAFTLSDPADYFLVNAPIANSGVSGTIAIKFTSFDNNQSRIPYNIKLYDSATCNDTYFGLIATGNATSTKTTANSVNWNTRNTQTRTNLPDGQYCLKICLSYKKGNTNYSVCNGRRVNTSNRNSSPVITSAPPTKEYKEGESYSYKVTATDPNGDKLVFRLINNPGFLTINNLTGQITSTPLTTNNKESITYSAVIKVEDGKGGETTQNISFKVTKTNVIQPGNPGQPTDGSDGEQPNQPGEKEQIKVDIKFNSPSGGEVLTDKAKVIRWNLSQEDKNEISNLGLQYSKDQKEWKTISEKIDLNFNYYVWDLTNIENGAEYFLKFNVSTSDNQNLEIKSDKFSINKANPSQPEQPTQPGDETSSSPLIVDVEPANNSQIPEDRDIVLTGKFAPSEGATINKDSFKIKIDGKEYQNVCTINEAVTEFRCNITDNLELGVHYVESEVTDSTNKKGTLDWFFTIIEVGQANNTDGESETPQPSGTTGINLGSSGAVILIIVLVIFLLLVIPWLLYRIWLGGNKKRNEKRATNNEVQNTTFRNDGSPVSPIAPLPPDLNNQGAYIYNPNLENQFNQSYMQPIEPLPQPVQPAVAEPQDFNTEPVSNYAYTQPQTASSQPQFEGQVSSYAYDNTPEPTNTQIYQATAPVQPTQQSEIQPYQPAVEPEILPSNEVQPVQNTDYISDYTYPTQDSTQQFNPIDPYNTPTSQVQPSVDPNAPQQDQNENYVEPPVAS